MQEFSLFGRLLPLTVAALLIVAPIGGLEAGLLTGQAVSSSTPQIETATASILTDNQQLRVDNQEETSRSDREGTGDDRETRDEQVSVTAIEITSQSAESLSAETVGAPSESPLVLSPDDAGSERVFALYFNTHGENDIEQELLVDDPGAVTIRTGDGVDIERVTDQSYTVMLSAPGSAPEVRTETVPLAQSMIYRTKMPVADLTLDGRITAADLQFHTSDRTAGMTEIRDHRQRSDGTVRLRFDGFPTETETNTIRYVTSEPDLVVIIDPSAVDDHITSLSTHISVSHGIYPQVLGGEQR